VTVIGTSIGVQFFRRLMSSPLTGKSRPSFLPARLTTLEVMLMKRLALAGLVLFAVSGAYSWAQTFPLPAPPQGVISANDLAFQLDRTESGRAIGRLMVRVDGKWLVADVTGRGRVVPLQTK
jgi:hypothetical protein